MAKITFSDEFEATLWLANKNDLHFKYKAAVELYERLLTEYPERAKANFVPEKLKMCKRELAAEKRRKAKKKKKGKK